MQWVVIVLLVVVYCLILFGCGSAVRDTHRAASKAAALARSSESRFNDIATSVLLSPPPVDDIHTSALEGASEQARIQSLAGVVQERTTELEDKVPYWMTTLKWWGVAAALVAVVVVLWQTGAGLLIKKVVWSIGLLIPSGKRAEVKMDIEALEGEPPSPIREAVAAKRGRDPAYEAAFKKAKKNKPKETSVAPSDRNSAPSDR